MKKMILSALIVLGLTASVSLASIGGSAHDFANTTKYPTNWSSGQICAPCHAPHNTIAKDAEGNDIEAPLWNHKLPSNSYRMYVGGVDTASAKVDENSILCLSCHDGTIALDSFGGVTGTTMLASGNKANLSTDLRNDHPMGDAAIWPTPNPSYMVDPALRTAAGIMPLRPMTDGKLAVGCTSCHEPHNRKNTRHMLWVANNAAGTTVAGTAVSGSVLCLNCHKK
jgi:hypothetical protein